MMYKDMNCILTSANKFYRELDDSENSPENSVDLPRSTVTSDKKITSSKRRRGLQKRAVSVPIKAVEGFRPKGLHMSSPPSDSWAWRKYGQKPIKGSPYPRGYYRCSSSKGCPARKQVERSKMDPTMLTVTYACVHNHPWPPSRNTHHLTTKTSTSAAVSAATSLSEEEIEEEENKSVNVLKTQPQEPLSEYKFPNLPLINSGEFGWFTDFESTLENPILTEDRIDSEELGMMLFTMREEDEPLFADLGELPECSTVFSRVGWRSNDGTAWRPPVESMTLTD